MKIAGQSGAMLAALKQHTKEVSAESDRRNVANKRVDKHIAAAKSEKQEVIQDQNERNVDQRQVIHNQNERNDNQRQVSQATAVDHRQAGLAAEEGSQGAPEQEAGADQSGSLLKQRVARWVENGAAIARKMVMPAQLRPLPHAEMTAANVLAKDEAQKEWRDSAAKETGDNPSLMRQNVRHGMQRALSQPQVPAVKIPAQGSADAAPVLPEKQQQPEEQNSPLKTRYAATRAADKGSADRMMPARAQPLPEVTAASFKAKAEAQKEWSGSVAKALSENRSPALQMIQHDLQLSLYELRGRAEKPPAQDSTDAALVLPEELQQLEERTSMLETLNAAVLAGDDGIMSSWDIDQFLQDSINAINNSYLSTYTNILSKFNTFFSDFADFKSKISQYVTAGKDGKLVINSAGILTELDSLINKYSYYALYPADGKIASKEDATKWAKEMGLPDSCIVDDGQGDYSVVMDISPLKTIRDSVYNTFGSSTKNVDSAQYQAWLAGFDMQADKYQNFMQVMTQKYTTANSVFDNLIKVLSSTITSLLESDKSFFNI